MTAANKKQMKMNKREAETKHLVAVKLTFPYLNSEIQKILIKVWLQNIFSEKT